MYDDIEQIRFCIENAKSKMKQKETKSEKDESITDNPFANLSVAKIEVDNNHIYFYSEVKRDKILILGKHIRKMNKTLKNLQIDNDLDKPPNIYLHINSFGGDIWAAMAAIDIILDSEIPVITIVEGCAASSATLMSIAGHKRYITKHSYMLIHQLSSSFWGKMQEIEDEYINLKKIMSMIKNIYKQYAHVKMEDLDSCLRRDIWWDATECLENGLVDEIMGQQKPTVNRENKKETQDLSLRNKITTIANTNTNTNKRLPPIEKPSSYDIGTKVVSKRDNRTYVVAKNKRNARYWKQS
jgi:ATP-dependent Clp endopeptidase proteolytic subunit ClpP